MYVPSYSARCLRVRLLSSHEPFCLYPCDTYIYWTRNVLNSKCHAPVPPYPYHHPRLRALAPAPLNSQDTEWRILCSLAVPRTTHITHSLPRLITTYIRKTNRFCTDTLYQHKRRAVNSHNLIYFCYCLSMFCEFK